MVKQRKSREGLIYDKSKETTQEGQILGILNSPMSAGSKVRVMVGSGGGEEGIKGIAMTLTGKVVPCLVGKGIGSGVLVVEIPDKGLTLKS
jgi:hypothetical protein